MACIKKNPPPNFKQSVSGQRIGIARKQRKYALDLSFILQKLQLVEGCARERPKLDVASIKAD